MSILKSKLETLQETLKRTGFYSVFVSNVAAKIFTFLGGVIIVRILSKGDYGLYTYVMNCYGILFILNDFGCNVASMQYRSENHETERLYKEYFVFPFKFALIFASVGSILILFSPYFYPYTQESAKQLTQYLCLLPLLNTVSSFISSNLRVEMKNKRFAILNTFDVIVHYGVILPFSYFWNVTGAVISNYVIALASIAFGLILSKDSLNFCWKKTKLNKGQKKEFLKYAFASQINNSIGALLSLFDVFLIGLIIANNEITSSYKVASTIPAAFMFIPNSILVYAGPMFARNINNKGWVKRNYRKMMLGLLIANGIITLGGIFLASYVVTFIYGREYTDAIPCFIILMINYFFTGTFQIPSANIIYTQHKVKVNIMITIISNIMNCILDVVLIGNFGSIGAAFATLSVSICASVMAFGYMWRWLKQNE